MEESAAAGGWLNRKAGEGRECILKSFPFYLDEICFRTPSEKRFCRFQQVPESQLPLRWECQHLITEALLCVCVGLKEASVSSI